MKRYRNIFTLVLSALLAFACSKEDPTAVYNADTAQASVLGSLESAYTLASADTLAVSFTEAKYDAPAVLTTYTLYMDLAGNNFADAVSLASVTSATDGFKVTHSAINRALLDKNVTAGTATAVEFRIVSNLQGAVTDNYALTSNVVTTTLTPYSAAAEYAKVWAVGDYCGWNHSNSQYLYNFLKDNTTFEGVIDFGTAAANGFKFTNEGSWSASGNYGTGSTAPTAEASTITLVNDGGSGNITAYSSRFYKFSFNTSTLVLTKEMSFSKLGVIGSGVGGWNDSNEIEMSFDAATQEFYVDVTLVDGEIKFRIDASWSTNYGGVDGILKSGGDNIAVTAGTYQIRVNLNNSESLTYTIKQK